MKVGEQIEDFEFEAYHNGKVIKGSSEDYRGKWLVLFFYPRDFTFVCPTELRGFAKMLGAFEEENASVIACSTDSLHSHRAWFTTDLKEIMYPVIADTNHEISTLFDILQKDGSALRGTFIINPDGILEHQTISNNNVGRNVEETLRVLRAVKTGDLCPVEWQPGKPTLGSAK
jgi:peroxiredoxin 2/4